jgi:hypothetical protein
MVDMSISEAILKQATLSENGGKVFLFSGDGNDKIEGIVTPQTRRHFHGSIFKSFKKAAMVNPTTHFYVVCLKNNLSDHYKQLAKRLSNVHTLTLSQFIRGNISKFLPLAQRSVNLMSCVMHELPDGWREDLQDGLRCFKSAHNTVLHKDLPDTHGVEIPLRTRILDFVSDPHAAHTTIAEAVASRHAAALHLQPAAVASRHAAALHLQPAAVTMVTRVPPKYHQLLNQSTFLPIDEWLDTSTRDVLSVCPSEIGKAEWIKQLHEFEQETQHEILIHNLYLCNIRLNSSRLLREKFDKMKSLDRELLIEVLFYTDDNLQRFFSNL